MVHSKKPPKPWKLAEEDRLRLLFPIRQNAALAKLFNRSTESIKRKAAKLGLHKDIGGGYVLPQLLRSNVWKPEEVRDLKYLYPRKTSAEVARRLGRTRQAVVSKAKKLGLTCAKEKRWNKKDIECLKQHYAEKGAAYVAQLLGRKPQAVRAQACKLGISRDLKTEWSQADEQRLREIYFTLPIAQVAERLGCSVAAVKHRAWKLRMIKQDRWTPQAEEQLRQLYGTHTYAQIADIMGLPLEAVKAKGKRMGLQHAHRAARCAVLTHTIGAECRKNKLPNSTWTPQEEDLLRQLYADYTYHEIGRALGRSFEAVKSKSRHLGLSNRQT
jgi:DNA-binding CsgD family transcriptional regulator/ribosomal protein L32E